tara:strand:- start:55306 stop:55638 length:333 start_codon:yes stop_codon:yes gene_type:complete
MVFSFRFGFFDTPHRKAGRTSRRCTERSEGNWQHGARSAVARAGSCISGAPGQVGVKGREHPKAEKGKAAIRPSGSIPRSPPRMPAKAASLPVFENARRLKIQPDPGAFR